jgi:peptidoglycan/xylan/chitin deacetylase (PgdA/CDA1 family)
MHQGLQSSVERDLISEPMRPQRVLKEWVARCLSWSGVLALLRVLIWRDRVLVLVYHDPRPEVMRSHLSYLCKIAEPIRFSELSSASNGRPRFVITIDDGHAGNRRLVDVFRQYGVVPTIFVCSQIIGTKRQFWWQFSDQIADQCEQLKRRRNRDRLAALAVLGYSQEAEVEPAAALSLEDIESMKPYCEFQSHGRFHPILTCCDDNECEAEIVRSRKEIQQLTVRDCSYFAFPNGNYGKREIQLLRSAGYLAARTLDLGFNDADSDPFRLKAVAVSDDCSPRWLSVQISMAAAYVRYLRQGSWSGRSPQF